MFFFLSIILPLHTCYYSCWVWPHKVSTSETLASLVAQGVVRGVVINLRVVIVVAPTLLLVYIQYVSVLCMYIH